MTVYIIIVICCAAASLIFTLGQAQALKSMFSSSLSGITGLIILNSVPVLGATITVNLFSFCVCAAFGIPGLMSLLLMRIICSV